MCREQLPVWQKFYEAHRQANFEILAIAMDVQGAEVVRRFTASAQVSFPTAVDRAQGLWKLYGFDVVPNGFFVDEQGILRYRKVGGFDVRNPADAQAIESLLAEKTDEPPVSSSPSPTLASVEQALRQAVEDAKRDPENLDKLLTVAERRVEAKQYDQARRDLESALAIDPKSARALLGLAAVYLDLGERQKAAAA